MMENEAHSTEQRKTVNRTAIYFEEYPNVDGQWQIYTHREIHFHPDQALYNYYVYMSNTFWTLL